MSLASKLIQSLVIWTGFSEENKTVLIIARQQSVNIAYVEAKIRVFSHPLGLKTVEVFWLFSKFKYSPVL